MKEERSHMLDLLRFNKGFSSPEEWVDYGIQHNFKRVRADKLDACPDCSSRSSRSVGQFIYYSTLVRLQLCIDCGLIFADTRIDSQVIQSHFENAYKDEHYFLRRRRRVFDQLACLISRAAPRGGRVLDVGGAKGHLLAVLQQQRPDLGLVLNDLSTEACNHAAECYGFEVIPGDVNALERVTTRFDVVVMSDVVYYEPDLKKLWALLPRLLAPGGSIIIRMPNKLSLIKGWQLFLRFSGREKMCMQKRIRFFNPEHLYVLSRSYLTNRFKKAGFSQIRFLPSELLVQEQENIRYPLFYSVAKAVSLISLGAIVLTPSYVVIASASETTVAND
ncbi:class I SAM-dependent methyltransferase [Pelotalea chapellei]|uniref:Methyltransferase domain-containing protein n=1 Tax=Pelotalea chapellei TaxID=44671 RepID=A0ABS5U840_9BACT|nr:class I SAM-dependent methyltransferase [Pelotalea chapellei]MBT1071826.1 methyltransferase domain-containing protein [Pelotalea chapellei]